MTDSTSLIPVEERTVEFYGDPITAVLVSGDSQPEIYADPPALRIPRPGRDSTSA